MSAEQYSKKHGRNWGSSVACLGSHGYAMFPSQTKVTEGKSDELAVCNLIALIQHTYSKRMDM